VSDALDRWLHEDPPSDGRLTDEQAIAALDDDDEEIRTLFREIDTLTAESAGISLADLRRNILRAQGRA
jgi:hypothetical protein